MDDLHFACPRCEQDWLLNVRLVYLNLSAVFCPECNALWIEQQPNADNFNDYNTFMIERGRSEPGNRDEIKILGYFSEKLK